MPVVLWTVQRTGGTSLATALAGLFPSPQIEHEPFNQGRVWSKYLREDDPQAQIREALPGLLGDRPLVKHCCELHPHWLSRLLLEASSQAGYRQVVLIRQDETEWMMSLVFAERTGLWGKTATLGVAHGESVGVGSGGLGAAKAIQHSRHSTRALDLLKEELTVFGCNHFVVSFEQLYRSGVPIMSNAPFLDLVRFAGVSEGTLSLKATALARIMQENEQGTRHLYADIPDMPTITGAIEPVCRLATGKFMGSGRGAR